MNAGDIVLISLPQLGGGAAIKLRPALVLALLPGPYQNVLLCGISTQLQLIQASWDELIQAGDGDFASSGLHQESVVRLSYLYAPERTEITGSIGRIDPLRLTRLRTRLADHLRP
jgi:mRNA interferase MazF